MQATAQGFTALDEQNVSDVALVSVSLIMTQDEANALAAARIARLPADLLAADAKPTAQAVADALIAAGYGS